MKTKENSKANEQVFINLELLRYVSNQDDTVEKHEFNSESDNNILWKDFKEYFDFEIEEDKSDATEESKCYYDEDSDIIVRTVIYEGEEYVHLVKQGLEMLNPIDDYVTPLCLHKDMNDKGRKFLLEYYAEDIKLAKKRIKEELEELKNNLALLEKVEKSW